MTLGQNFILRSIVEKEILTQDAVATVIYVTHCPRYQGEPADWLWYRKLQPACPATVSAKAANSSLRAGYKARYLG